MISSIGKAYEVAAPYIRVAFVILIYFGMIETSFLLGVIS